MTREITPFLQPGRKTYAAFVHCFDGTRGNRSLGTQIKKDAEIICAEIEGMERRMLMPRDPALALCSEEAYRAFYGTDKPSFVAGVTPADRWDILKLQAELETLRGEVKRLQGIEEKYKAIAQSVEGRQVEATRKSPTLKGCNADYMEDIAGLSGALKSAHKLFLKQFTEMVGADTKLAEITPSHIINFIRADAAAHKDPRRAVRVRTLVSRFINWAARKYQIPSIMSQVPTQRVGAIRDIEWHTLKEVEKVIAELDTYWGAIVAAMAFAGLSAHEVRGLRKQDIQEVKKRRIIVITPTEARGLKTAKRKRTVAISSRLAKHLDPLIAKAKKPEALIFPALTGGDKGLWHDETFSRQLNLRLPKGMDALSLRRTFGSLLIRAGKSEEEVAAAMGNSATMVRQHYGRILGGEVDLDF